MIDTYEKRSVGKEKIFVRIKDKKVSSITIGNHAISKSMGFQFYVDDYVAEQIEKCELFIDGLTPSLRVKQGEEIIIPELSEKEIRKRNLEYELEQLEKGDD